MTPEPKTIDEYRDALETLNQDEMLLGLRLQVAEIQARRLKIEALTAERDALKAEVALWIRRSDKTWYEKRHTERIDALEKSARLALEALEQLIDLVPNTKRECSCHISPPCSNCIDNSIDQEMKESGESAITALKAVLK